MQLQFRHIAALAAVGVLAACGTSAQDARPGRNAAAGSGVSIVTLDGSSTVFPISEAVAEEFQRSEAKTRITVGISGTGGGFQKFCRGDVDIADASRPIMPVEAAACAHAGIEYIELPIAYDGIAIAVNPQAQWADSITVAELKRLWAPEAQGRIMRWSQLRQGWPDREIHLFGAGVDSGTYDYFTEAIVGAAKASRGDFTSSEDDNVLVQGIGGDALALGFVPFAYYEGNQEILKVLPVDDGRTDNGEGAVAPTADSIRTGRYQPLSRPVFVYVTRQAAERDDVRSFVNYYLKHAGALVQEVGYVPLGDRVYALAADRFARNVVGSAFSGRDPVGVTLDQLLATESGR